MLENASSTLSIAIIARDEAAELKTTLESVREIADQIVVVNTGASDEIAKVAQSHAANVVGFEWCDDFSAARNAALSHVTSSWVLWLDVGEELSADDATALRQFVNTSATPTNAYALLVCVPANGPTAAPEQIARVRLVPNKPELQFTGRVRESLDAALAGAGIEVEGAPFRIRRRMRDHEPELKAERARRNIGLADLEIGEGGAKPYLLNCLGDALQTLHDNDRASQFYRHALAASESGSPEMLEAYYGLITSLDNDPANVEEQLALCVDAIKIFPLDAQLLCAMGGYLQAHGQHELALKTYQTAQQYGQVNPTVWHIGEIREIATICYAMSLQLAGREDEGQQVINASISEQPDSIRLRRHLIESHISRADRDAALAEVAQLPSDFPHIAELRSAIRGACLAADNNWLVAKSYLKTAYEAGCRDPICLRWLATTLITTGDLAAAEPILREWQVVEPTNSSIGQYLAAIEKPSNEEAIESCSADPARQVRIDAAGEGSPGQSAPHSSRQHSPSRRAQRGTTS